MRHQYSSIWHSIPSNLDRKIENIIDKACDLIGMKDAVYVFFRADDVAVPGHNVARLLALFTKYRLPISLAVVPAWLTGPRWGQLKKLGQNTPELLCWHQHGWRHLNHEKKGKKQEFGPSRSYDQIKRDIINGRDRLEIIMENSFYPVFTPPWNRCNLTTLKVLKELGYKAVSRIIDYGPPAPNGLVDFQVNVDLHTRKGGNPTEDWESLLAEFSRASCRSFNRPVLRPLEAKPT